MRFDEEALWAAAMAHAKRLGVDVDRMLEQAAANLARYRPGDRWQLPDQLEEEDTRSSGPR